MNTRYVGTSAGWGVRAPRMSPETALSYLKSRPHFSTSQELPYGSIVCILCGASNYLIDEGRTI